MSAITPGLGRWYTCRVLDSPDTHDTLERLLGEGWEPFAVWSPPEGFPQVYLRRYGPV